MLVRSLALLWALGPAVVHAALPLITDDTGTQGRGNFQLELTQEQSLLRQAGADQQMTVTSAVLSYGAVDSTDLILSIPYLRLGDSPDSGTSGAGGAGDANLDIKWRFYVDHAFSLSFKSGVSFSNGDETRGLGTGRVGWSNYLTATYEAAPWALHTHVGYRRRNNVLGERVDLWHASAAIVRQMGNSLKLIADAGIDTRTDPGANSDPLFLVGGLIWSLHKNFDIDAGYKLESSDTLRARTLLAGIAFRW